MDEVDLFERFAAEHRAQLESAAVPQHLWQALYQKLATEDFDAGEHFQLMLIDYEDDDDDDDDDDDGASVAPVASDGTRPAFTLTALRDISATDPAAIFLIDHAWTFRTNLARRQLEQHEALRNRMCAITGVDVEESGRVNRVLQRMWRYCQAYSISDEALSAEERMPIWYIMDEVGSAVNHSDDPNCRVVPFFHVNTRTTYSLLFTVRDCEEGEHITRDFVEYVARDAPERDAMLLFWRHTDLRDQSFVQAEPAAEYFLSGHIPETLPAAELAVSQAPPLSRNEPLKVYAEYYVVRDHLNAPCFELVENEADADVLWLTHHFKSFAELAEQSPHKFVNQFPYEYVLTIKDLLSITCRRAAREHHNAATLETYPRWLPTTFNLKTELRQFAAYFQQRASKGLDNHWIVKPWNLARCLDTHITDNISQIVRLPATGPKIVQKYIERPVLYYRADVDAKVKFDVRYCVLLKSAQPLEAYVYRQFFLRFANKPFGLTALDDYEKHFTVMNYQEDTQLHHVKCEDFQRHWQDQYPAHPWSAVEDDICGMLYEVLECATQCSPPRGIPANRQSRAMYAADIMLEWTGTGQQAAMQPKLLEVNWTPDCQRACDYYPDFFNDIFKLLFLDESNEDSFRLLLPSHSATTPPPN